MYNYDLSLLMEMLGSIGPLHKSTTESLQANFDLRFNQSSNAIEGNQLTLMEARILLEFGLTAEGKCYYDHWDIINHKIAIDYMHELVRANELLSEKHLLEFNYLLLKNTRDELYGVS